MKDFVIDWLDRARDALATVWLWLMDALDCALRGLLFVLGRLAWSAPKAAVAGLLAAPTLPYRVARMALVIFFGLALTYGTWAYAKHKVVAWAMKDYIERRDAEVAKLKKAHAEKLAYLQRELDVMRAENARLEAEETATDQAANRAMTEIVRQGSSCVLDDEGLRRVNAIVAEANR